MTFDRKSIITIRENVLYIDIVAIDNFFIRYFFNTYLQYCEIFYISTLLL